jgi:hypothetical protein
MTAEHLKLAKNITKPLLTIINKIQENRTIPRRFKCGQVTPILNKGKSMYNSEHYRRITVTPISSKILETVILPSIDESMSQRQSSMQRGFTAGSSSTNTACIHKHLQRRQL